MMVRTLLCGLIMTSLMMAKGNAQQFDFPLSTAANYLYTFDGAARSALVIDLAQIGVFPGSTVTLEMLGGVNYGPPLPDNEGMLLGAFSSTSTLLPNQPNPRIPGIIAAGTPYDTSWANIGDIPEDFLISSRFFRNVPAQVPPNFNGVTIVVPPGAGYLFVMVLDDNYVDNVDQGLGVRLTRAGAPPTANAGPDFGVNEGQYPVTLNGTGSSDPDGDPVTFLWEQVVDGSPLVALAGANTSSPTFTAPGVALGGETLTFKLTVTANGDSSIDTVSVTVANVNHPPVADAGADQSIAEGSPVSLHGEGSFDIDWDPFTLHWVQVNNGGPLVTLTGANTAAPSFTAPYVGDNGAPGIVATLEFELRVDDGLSLDLPAPGYTFGDVADRVTIQITNTNNAPTADAGADQTVNEHTTVTLDGAGSRDPDSDALTYAWTQTMGAAVALIGGNTARPSFTAPFVNTGGSDLSFVVTINDGYGGTSSDSVVVHVQNVNDPPLASAARPSLPVLWPPNHSMALVSIVGVTDPNDNATIVITGVTQDEPTTGLGDGDTAVDAVINADGTVLLRAERSGQGNGRVYHIHFTASDLEGGTSGVVTVSVPHSAKVPVVDGGESFDSTR